MAGKYISIDEAAAILGISTDELNTLREKQEIRAFADRGNWKFRIDDVETLQRSREADSVPEMPSMDDVMADFGDTTSSASSGSSFQLKDDDQGDTDSDVKLDPSVGGSSDSSSGSETSFLLADDMDEEGEEPPTSISKELAPTPSDSDVRLIVDESVDSDNWPGASEQNPEAPAQPEESSIQNLQDSDVRFADVESGSSGASPAASLEDDSKIALNESDARWAGISDSDVRLSGIESNVTPAESGSFDLVDDSSDVKITESEVTISSDDEVPLMVEDSGITLMPMDDNDEDSSIRLDADDDNSVLSDISMPDSGITIGADSGISLELAADSGLSLEEDDDSLTLAGDGSGISLMPDSDVGLTLADDEQQDGATIPMLDTVDEDSDAETTSFDMPMMSDGSSEEFEEAADVVMFDDDEDTNAEFAFDDDGSTDDIDATSDVFSGTDSDMYSDELSGELDVADEILSDDDILEADDASFDDEFESDGSVAELAPLGGARGGAMAATTQWSGLDMTLVLVPTLLMGVGAFLMYDVIRSMWAYNEPFAFSGMVLDALRGMFPGS